MSNEEIAKGILPQSISVRRSVSCSLAKFRLYRHVQIVVTWYKSGR